MKNNNLKGGFMDQVQKENIEKYFSMNNMFLSIMKDQKFDEKALRLMKTNLTSMQLALKELGVSFDDNSDRIKVLNERIRELEGDMGKGELTYTQVSAFIGDLQKKIEQALKVVGFSGRVNVSFEPNLTILIQFYVAHKNSLMPYDKNDQEREERIKKEIEEFETFKQNFVYEKTDEHKDSDLMAMFDEKNIQKVEKIVSNVIGMNSDNLDTQIKNRFKRIDGKIAESIPILSEMKFTFFTLPSHRSFSEALAKFYE